MNLLWIYIDMPADDPEPENEIFPEIIVDETDYIPSDEELEPEPEPEPVVPEQPVQIEPPQQDDMFQTGKPVKKKRQVSEKQRQHLDRIRAKALERKKEKADARKKEKQAVDTPPPPVIKPITQQATAPAPAPAPAQQYLTKDDVDHILDRYKEKRQIRKRAKAKEVEATQLVHTHLQKDDVWEQCFN